jgi:flagellin-like hook-associated protein FlgL
MSVIDLRKSFTEDMSTMLQVGAEDLTLANMEEESASLLSLQTSQSLALNSLTIASQTAQSILRLFQ